MDIATPSDPQATKVELLSKGDRALWGHLYASPVWEQLRESAVHSVVPIETMLFSQISREAVASSPGPVSSIEHSNHVPGFCCSPG